MNYKRIVDDVLQIFENRKRIFKEKNSDYGCSYVKAGEIFGIIAEGKPIVIDSREKQIIYQILVRIVDKLVRIINLTFFSKSLVNESIAETAGDLGVYALMLEGQVNYALMLEGQVKSTKIGCVMTAEGEYNPL